MKYALDTKIITYYLKGNKEVNKVDIYVFQII